MMKETNSMTSLCIQLLSDQFNQQSRNYNFNDYHLVVTETIRSFIRAMSNSYHELKSIIGSGDNFVLQQQASLYNVANNLLARVKGYVSSGHSYDITTEGSFTFIASTPVFHQCLQHTLNKYRFKENLKIETKQCEDFLKEHKGKGIIEEILFDENRIYLTPKFHQLEGQAKIGQRALAPQLEHMTLAGIRIHQMTDTYRNSNQTTFTIWFTVNDKFDANLFLDVIEKYTTDDVYEKLTQSCKEHYPDHFKSEDVAIDVALLSSSFSTALNLESDTAREATKSSDSNVNKVSDSELQSTSSPTNSELPRLN